MKKNKFLLLAIFIMFLMLPFTVNGMPIKIKPEDQEAFVLEVESSDTIEFLKSEIQDEHGILAISQNLIFDDVVLENGRTLADYEIQKNDEIGLFYKTELTIIEMTLDNPKAGNKPDTLVDMVLYNADKSKKVEIKDVNLVWFRIDGGEVDEIPLEENDVFEKGKEYLFQFPLSADKKMSEALEANDSYASLSTSEVYLNGKLFAVGNSFYVGGVETIDIVVDNLVAGQKFPPTARVIIKINTETKEFIVPILKWMEAHDSSHVQLDKDALADKNIKYFNVLDFSNNNEISAYLTAVDFRTEHYCNGKSQLYYEIDDIYKVVFDANGGTFKGYDKYIIDEWANELYDSLVVPTREGYKFVGYFTEKNGGTKFEMILNESGIDEDMTFYAQWEVDEEVPKTFDGIRTSIFIGTISLVGLIGAIIYLKKRNNVRA